LIRFSAAAVPVRHAAPANELIRMGAAGADALARMLHLVYTQAAICRLHGADSASESARGNAANPYASFEGAYRWRFFFACSKRRR
jgi:hypothetical protein